jgi:hypothetical protein
MGTATPIRNVLTTLTRRLLLTLCCTIALFACGSGLDPEEAKTYCDQERQTDPTCVDDAAYQSCLSCYEDCGVDCLRGESCPLQFSCE